MTVVNEDIENTKLNMRNQFVTSHSTSSFDRGADGLMWYILRYKVLNKNTRDFFFQNSEKVFFPYHKVSKVRVVENKSTDHNYRGSRRSKYTEKIETYDRPVIPGYIFIQGPLSDAQEIAKKVNLGLWMKNSRQRNSAALSKAEASSSGTVTLMSPVELRSAYEQQYHSISHKAMLRFMEVISYYKNDVKLYDPAEVDLEQNDEVEFVTGPMKGQRGYVRKENGKAGGLVIVPMSTSQTSDKHKASDGVGKVRGSLCYGFKVSASEFRIVRFANNARHTDCLKAVNARVKEILVAYGHGKTIDEKVQKKLKGYLMRYEEAEMSTSIQRANHILLLYRIYTILENKFMLLRVRQRINEEIIPAYDKRISTEHGERKGRVVRQKETFLKEVEDIEQVSRLRQ